MFESWNTFMLIYSVVINAFSYLTVFEAASSLRSGRSSLAWFVSIISPFVIISSNKICTLSSLCVSKNQIIGILLEHNIKFTKNSLKKLVQTFSEKLYALQNGEFVYIFFNSCRRLHSFRLILLPKTKYREA